MRRKIHIGFRRGKLKRIRQLGRPKYGRDYGTDIDLSRHSDFIWLGIGVHDGLFERFMNLLV